MRLSLDEVDQDGLVRLETQSIDLPVDLAPGDSAHILLRAVRGQGFGGRWHEIGLYAEGAGPFKGAGRTGTASVFAETVEAMQAPGLDVDAT